ncbi:MAG: PhnD/SsuA/transferrin family substrate-binding protein [Acidimicrobiia bacterium]|nr:PhnD/SsuA/transferrin family substrate-binding protein [Acidimicrobiia bacterium]
MERHVARSQLVAWLLVMCLVLSACGGGGEEGETTTAEGSETITAAEQPGTTSAAAEELRNITVLLPIDSPILHGFRVADAAGYYANEGLAIDFQPLDGGGEVVTQLLAGNGDIANIPVGPVVEAIEQGETHIRAVWNYVYGSIFYIAVPADSDIETAADLEGRQVGISALSGGEVPIVRGIIESAGLNPDEDVELVAIGAGTALSVRALQEGQVDAYGGSVNDIIALQAQGLDLRYILPDELLELPASGIVVPQELIDSDADLVEGFLRASTMGSFWATVNPDASLCVLKEATPEQFTEETGEMIFDAVLPITWAPEGVEMGFQSPETWGTFFDFIGAERPDVDLDDIVIDDFIDAANDFDPAEVEADADAWPEC